MLVVVAEDANAHGAHDDASGAPQPGGREPLSEGARRNEYIPHDDHSRHRGDDGLGGKAVRGNIEGRIDHGSADESERIVPRILCYHGKAQQLLATGPCERRDSIQQHTDEPQVIGPHGFARRYGWWRADGRRGHALLLAAGLGEAIVSQKQCP